MTHAASPPATAPEAPPCDPARPEVLYTPPFRQMPLEELERRPWQRRWRTLRAIWAARRNALNVFHPDLYHRRWHVTPIPYGDIVTVCDPDLARHVLQAKAGSFRKSPLYKVVFEDFLGDSSLTMEGAEWKTRRRLISPAFNARALKRLEGIVERHVEGMLDGWDRAVGNGPEAEVDLTADVNALAMRIAMEAFFSSSLGGREAETSRLMDEIILAAGTLPFADMLGLPKWFPRESRAHIPKLRDRLDAILYETIDARLARRAEGCPEVPDLLDILIHAKDEETGALLDREAVRNEVMTLFAAGHETTALSLAWGLDRLSREGAVQARLAEACAGAGRVGTDGALGTAEARALPMVAETYDEMLRLYPPAFVVGREAVEDAPFEDLPLTAGTRVEIPIFILHRAPRLWDAPEAFRPERHLPENKKDRHPFAFIPFGAGPRICVGLALARLEGQLVIARGLSRFELRPAGPQPDPMGKITLRTEKPVKMRVRRRVGAASTDAAAA